MFWPSGLTYFYPHPGLNLPMWKIIGAGLILIGITVTVLIVSRRSQYLVVGWLWYLATLVPVIGLGQVGQQAMADRYAYVPLIGLYIIIAWGIPSLLATYHQRSSNPKVSQSADRILLSRREKTALAASAVILISILISCTRLQIRHWRTSITLY